MPRCRLSSRVRSSATGARRGKTNRKKLTKNQARREYSKPARTRTVKYTDGGSGLLYVIPINVVLLQVYHSLTFRLLARLGLLLLRGRARRLGTINPLRLGRPCAGRARVSGGVVHVGAPGVDRADALPHGHDRARLPLCSLCNTPPPRVGAPVPGDVVRLVGVGVRVGVGVGVGVGLGFGFGLGLGLGLGASGAARCGRAKARGSRAPPG